MCWSNKDSGGSKAIIAVALGENKSYKEGKERKKEREKERKG